MTDIISEEYVDIPLGTKNAMNEEKIIEMLLDHEGRLERIEKNMATKQDLAKISGTLDQILEISMSNSQEIKMTHRSIERLDNKASEHDKAI
ncbi:hypothetical protein COT83_00685, partial [Candidatus Peregrinibacteria bacterium CG10_big_fil_rev_8_21_14_0_10_44_7]